MSEGCALQAGVSGGNDTTARELEARLELDLRFGGRGEQALTGQVARLDRGAQHVRHFVRVHLLAIEQDVESRWSHGRTAQASAAAALPLQVHPEQHAARGGPLQALVDN